VRCAHRLVGEAGGGSESLLAKRRLDRNGRCRLSGSSVRMAAAVRLKRVAAVLAALSTAEAIAASASSDWTAARASAPLSCSRSSTSGWSLPSACANACLASSSRSRSVLARVLRAAWAAVAASSSMRNRSVRGSRSSSRSSPLRPATQPATNAAPSSATTRSCVPVTSAVYQKARFTRRDRRALSLDTNIRPRRGSRSQGAGLQGQTWLEATRRRCT
jgi:hypothetical protein